MSAGNQPTTQCCREERGGCASLGGWWGGSLWEELYPDSWTVRREQRGTLERAIPAEKQKWRGPKGRSLAWPWWLEGERGSRSQSQGPCGGLASIAGAGDGGPSEDVPHGGRTCLLLWKVTLAVMRSLG